MLLDFETKKYYQSFVEYKIITHIYSLDSIVVLPASDVKKSLHSIIAELGIII